MVRSRFLLVVLAMFVLAGAVQAEVSLYDQRELEFVWAGFTFETWEPDVRYKVVQHREGSADSLVLYEDLPHQGELVEHYVAVELLGEPLEVNWYTVYGHDLNSGLVFSCTDSAAYVEPGGHANECWTRARADTTPGPRPLEGWGAVDNVGGLYGEHWSVTSLEDSGPGSLREALSGSDRYVTVAVEGEIEVATPLYVEGSNLTLVGNALTLKGAPALESAVLDFRGCDHVIASNLRVQDAPHPDVGDCVRVRDGAHHVVLDHFSARGANDGNIDITDDAHHVTVQWSVLAECVKNHLLARGPSEVTLHHNLYVGEERNPQLDGIENGELVECVVGHWSPSFGVRIREGGSTNVVGNTWVPRPDSDLPHALILTEPYTVYMEDNELPDQCPAAGNVDTRHPAPPVTELGREAALEAVLNEAGAFPRDARDAAIVAAIRGE